MASPQSQNQSAPRVAPSFCAQSRRILRTVSDAVGTGAFNSTPSLLRQINLLSAPKHYFSVQNQDSGNILPARSVYIVESRKGNCSFGDCGLVGRLGRT